MNTPHPREAAEQVREIRNRMLSRYIFQGYSGAARVAAGICAILGAALLSRAWIPKTHEAHLVGWGLVCLVAFSINVFALYRWYVGTERENKGLRDLLPVVDVIAPLVVGGVLTFAIVQQEAYDLLFGMWMVLFGLANIASRHALPSTILQIGWFYICCGIFLFLLAPQTSFLNPWPMGIVFLIGETAGGLLFSQTRMGLDP